jgi:hypothetical protein
MAYASENVIDRMVHGKFGKMCIFRVRNNKTFMYPYPNYREVRWSALQKANRKRFRDAMIWARQTLEDAEKRKFYQKKAKNGQSVWNAAVADYMKRPQIDLIDAGEYRGRKGQTIRVTAHDNYLITTIMITIINALGIEVESRLIPNTSDYVVIEYKTLEENPDWQGGRVVVRITDSPGNVTNAFRVL